MRILILSSRIPYPLTAGFRIRIYATAKYLKKNGHQVELLQLTSESLESQIEKNLELESVFDNIYTVKLKKNEILINLLKAIFILDMPFQVAIYQNKEYRAKLMAIVHNYDCVISNHIRMGEYLKNIECNKILDMHDAVSYNYENAISVTNGFKKLIYIAERRRALNYEKDILKYFFKTVIISENDKYYLKKNGADTSRLEVIPVAVRDDISDRKESYEEDENSICFLGKMSYQPNEDAVIWFIENVYLKLQTRIKDITFYIIGVEPTERIKKMHNGSTIKVTGYLENPYVIIKRCKAMVVPIRNGAGMQNKILESMVVGTPTVISKIAAEGINGENGVHFFVAENGDEYIDYLCRLFEDIDLRRSMGEKAFELVQNYTWDKLQIKWTDIVSSFYSDRSQK